jgi:hypothetical protein
MVLPAPWESEDARPAADLAWLIDWVERAVIRWDLLYEEWPFEKCDDATWMRILADLGKVELWKIRDGVSSASAGEIAVKALTYLANDIAMCRGLPTRPIWNCSDLKELTEKRCQP